MRDEWTNRMGAFIAMLRPSEGFVALNSEWMHVAEFSWPLRPFLLWTASGNREEQ